MTSGDSALIAEPTSQVLKILKEAGVTPRGVQVTAVECGLLEGRSIMVCSPTGSGKTLVGEMAMIRAVCEGSRALYLVPLRALAVQVADKLKERYAHRGIPIGLSTGDYELPGNDLALYDIIVTTYERADSLLRHGVEWLSEVGTLVIDECQNLGDEVRGPRLESTVMRMRRLVPDLQIVSLSATIGSPQEMAEWLGCRLIESSQRPVPLKCSVVNTRDRAHTVRELVMTTIQRDGQALVFSRTRKEAEAEAKRLSSEVVRQMTSMERTKVDQEIDSIENFNITIPAELRPLLHSGVAFHHAGLPSATRRLVESLFSRGLIRAICATTTLAAGMDLPARTVILTSIRSPEQFRHMLPVNQVHQMLGRAGRPTRDNKGFGVVLAGSKGEAETIQAQYFVPQTDPGTGVRTLEPKYAPVVSRLPVAAALTEQLLVWVDHLKETSLESIENEVLSESYASHLARHVRTPFRLFHLGEVTAEAAIEHHALGDTVKAASQGVLGSASVRERRDAVIGGIVSERGGGQFTCRFSALASSDGTLEGAMCSCGRPIDDEGLLCPHLVTLGLYAARGDPASADYIVPLSLSESSPYGTLVRLGLIEGASDGLVRATPLGRIVDRLYLRIETTREMLAMLPLVNSNSDLLDLLKHLTLIETGQVPDSAFDAVIGSVVATAIPIPDIGAASGLPTGDVYSILERTRWLLHAIVAVADIGGMVRVSSMAAELKDTIENRTNKEDFTDGGSD